VNLNDLKKVAVGISVHEESYEQCEKCRTETPIGELNLVTGLCSACNTNKIKITKEQMRELLKLDRGFDE
jgi:Zn finger protein HypA/HybF involved in hydrogenase expression